MRFDELYQKMGISETIFYYCKTFGGLGISVLRELRMLNYKNVRLKKLVAYLSVDKDMLQDVKKKN